MNPKKKYWLTPSQEESLGALIGGIIQIAIIFGLLYLYMWIDQH